jgi:hypothetical protein
METARRTEYEEAKKITNSVINEIYKNAPQKPLSKDEAYKNLLETVELQDIIQRMITTRNKQQAKTQTKN